VIDVASMAALKEIDATGEQEAKARLMASIANRDSETLEIIGKLSDIYPGQTIASLQGEIHNLEMAKSKAKKKV